MWWILVLHACGEISILHGMLGSEKGLASQAQLGLASQISMRSGETSDIPFLSDSATFEKCQYSNIGYCNTTSTTSYRYIQLTSGMSSSLARAMGKLGIWSVAMRTWLFREGGNVRSVSRTTQHSVRLWPIGPSATTSVVAAAYIYGAYLLHSFPPYQQNPRYTPLLTCSGCSPNSSDQNNDQNNNIHSLESLLSYPPPEYSTNILSRGIVLRIYYPVRYPVLNFILYLLKDMNLKSLLSILYSSIISLKIIYATGYFISFRLVFRIEYYNSIN